MWPNHSSGSQTSASDYQGLGSVTWYTMWTLWHAWYWGTLYSKHFSFPFPVTTPPMLHILLSSAAGTISPLQATAGKNVWWPTAKVIVQECAEAHSDLCNLICPLCIVLILIWQPLRALFFEDLAFLIHFPESLSFSHWLHSSSYGLIYGPNIMLRRNPRFCCRFSLH